MRSTKEMQLEKMLDCLYLIGLTEEQVEMAERYLTGETKTFELERKEKRNAGKLDKDKIDKVRKQFEKLTKDKMYEAYAKFFGILFEMFGVSMKEFIDKYSIHYIIRDNERLKYMPKAEFIAVYGEMAGNSLHFIDERTFKDILMIAEHDNVVLERAMLELSNQDTSNGRLVLMAAYFIQNPKAERGSNLDGIKSMFLDRDKESTKKIFDKYVSILTTNMKVLFDGKITDDESKVLENYVNAGREEILSTQVCTILDKYDMNEFLLTLFVSCAAPNYKLSSKLSNFLKMCSYGKNFFETFFRIYRVIERMNPDEQVKDLKKDLQPDPVEYIQWCAQMALRNILKQEAKEDCASYIKAIEKANTTNYRVLIEVVKGLEPSDYDAYYKEALAEGIKKRQEKIVEEVVCCEVAGADGQLKNKVRAFLMGEREVAELYPYQKEFKVNRYYIDFANMLGNYELVYGKDAFYKRCETYSALKERYYDFLHGFSFRKVDKRQIIQEIFGDFKEVGLSIAKQIEIAGGIYRYEWSAREELVEIFSSLFSDYMQESETEVLDGFRNTEAEGRMLAIRTLERAGDKYKESLFEYFADGAKLVKNELVELLSKHEEWADEVLAKLNSKKAAEREMAVTIISNFKEGDYSTKLLEALEKEKSKKIADLLKTILHMEAVEEEKEEFSAESYVKEIHKGNRKRGLAWAYETAFVPVHFAQSSELASEEYLQAVLLTYSGMKLPGYNKEVFLLTDKLNKGELAVYVNELFDKWLEAGAQAKQKWVLFASAIHGGSAITEKMKRQIDEWAKNSRGAIAADAVKALALNDSPTALLLVDGIARKYKFKQVKAAAGVALENAAKELGLSTEELADKIVPDLGFNENMERIFDYGERIFKVYITPTLELEVYDQNDKKLKNIPAPGKKDDEVKAVAAYAEFKQMKKQLKTTVASQKQRLELALTIERKWKADKWQELFVKNPIMHQFAISRIWGCYENGVLKETFRYMEDGSFNTVDEDEYELPSDAVIGLVHPIELEEDIKKQWEEQLEDYEITQSIEQLNRPVYRVTDEEKDLKLLERFGGMVLNGLSLSGKMLSMGWYRGTALDAGFYVVYIREDKECDMGVALHFSGLSMGYENEEATVYGAHFYKPGSAKTVGFSYEYIKEEEACKLGEVPPRYFSEIVYQLTKATASSQEKDESWKEEFNRN